MANPIIFWDDGSARLEPVTPQTGGAGTVYSNTRFETPGGGVYDYNTETDDNQKALAILSTRRSTDRTRLPFSMQFLPDALLVADDTDEPVYVAVFGQGMTLEITDEYARGLERDSGDQRRFQYDSTDSVAAKIIRPFNHLVFDSDSPRDNSLISKWGNGEVTEIIVSRNAIELTKPPQESAYPNTSKMWEVFPRVSVRGDFLGASYRPQAGELNFAISMVPNSWIVEYWEPFREHISTGGIFAYALDWENDPTNVAYCYAAESVPAPVVKAGGYGDVEAKIGVAVI